MVTFNFLQQNTAARLGFIFTGNAEEIGELAGATTFLLASLPPPNTGF